MGNEAQYRDPLHNTRIGVPQNSTETRTATLRPSIRGDGVRLPGRHALLLTLTVLIPRFYNPDDRGVREPVEAEKIEETEQEMLGYFSGYQKFLIEGTYRDSETGEEFHDALVRFEIDAEFDHMDRAFLEVWRQTLEERFQQQLIYMKLVGPVRWL